MNTTRMARQPALADPATPRGLQPATRPGPGRSFAQDPALSTGEAATLRGAPPSDRSFSVEHDLAISRQAPRPAGRRTAPASPAAPRGH